MFVKKKLESLNFFNDATYTIFNIYYLIMHIFLIIYINFISALKEYQHDYDLNMIITVMKIKQINYFLDIPLIYLAVFVFDLHTRIDDSLSDYLNIYYESLYMIKS